MNEVQAIKDRDDSIARRDAYIEDLKAQLRAATANATQWERKAKHWKNQAKIVDESLETCHRLLNAHDGIEPGYTSLDCLDVRIERLLAELAEAKAARGGNER